MNINTTRDNDWQFLSHPNRKRKYWKSNNRNEGQKINHRILKGWKFKGWKQKGYIDYI